MEIQLGSKVTHKITGYTGIAIGKATYLTGCDQYCVKSQELKDGLPMDAQWFDVMMLDIVEAPTAKTLPNVEKKNGGPQYDAPRGK